MIPNVDYLLLSLGLFTIGVIGVLVRRNVIVILMSIELMLNAVNINLAAFSRGLQGRHGDAFAAIVIIDAVAEAAVGLGLIVALVRNKKTLNADQIDLLKW